MKGFLPGSLSKEWRCSLQAPWIYWRVGFREAGSIVFAECLMIATCFLRSQCPIRRRVQSNSVALPHGIQSVVPRSRFVKLQWLQWLPATSGRVARFILFEVIESEARQSSTLIHGNITSLLPCSSLAPWSLAMPCHAVHLGFHPCRNQKLLPLFTFFYFNYLLHSLAVSLVASDPCA